MSICEDYPCCGHTDGLGCDWVSPNEVVPCDICIEARASSPYHSKAEGCKTQRAKAREAVPVGANCFTCDDNEADTMSDDQPICFSCESEIEAYNRSMQEQYDDLWSRR